MSIVGRLLGGTRRTNFFGDSPIGLLSPPKKSELKLIEALLNFSFCATIHSGRYSSSSFSLSLLNKALHCYFVIETRESRCLQGRPPCSLPHCTPNDHGAGTVDLHEIYILLSLWRHALCEYDSYSFCTPSYDYMDAFS